MVTSQSAKSVSFLPAERRLSRFLAQENQRAAQAAERRAAIAKQQTHQAEKRKQREEEAAVRREHLLHKRREKQQQLFRSPRKPFASKMTDDQVQRVALFVHRSLPILNQLADVGLAEMPAASYCCLSEASRGADDADDGDNLPLSETRERPSSTNEVSFPEDSFPAATVCNSSAKIDSQPNNRDTEELNHHVHLSPRLVENILRGDCFEDCPHCMASPPRTAKCKAGNGHRHKRKLAHLAESLLISLAEMVYGDAATCAHAEPKGHILMFAFHTAGVFRDASVERNSIKQADVDDGPPTHERSCQTVAHRLVNRLYYLHDAIARTTRALSLSDQEEQHQQLMYEIIHHAESLQLDWELFNVLWSLCSAQEDYSRESTIQGLREQRAQLQRAHDELLLKFHSRSKKTSASSRVGTCCPDSSAAKQEKLKALIDGVAASIRTTENLLRSLGALRVVRSQCEIK